jgi:hypothetical protein
MVTGRGFYGYQPSQYAIDIVYYMQVYNITESQLPTKVVSVLQLNNLG